MKYENPVMEVTLLQFDAVVTSLNDGGDNEEGSGGGGIDLSNLNNAI